MSGLTALGSHESDSSKGSYVALADVLRQLGASYATDGEELFRRMVFDILVSNDDDHLRNHAFLLDEEGWRLSPAYDVVPHPQHGYSRQQAIGVGKHGRAATLRNATSECGRFAVTDLRATEIAGEVRTVVEQWREVFREHGVSESDLTLVQSALLPPLAVEA